MKIDWENVYRAWLAFLILQVCGSIFVSYAGFHGSKSVMFVSGEPTPASRFFALNQALLGVTRFMLMGKFDNHGLQSCHLLLTTAFSIHFAMELFYFKSLISSLYNIVLLVLNVVTIIFMLLRSFLIEAAPIPEKRRSGRLINAKHFMETDILKYPDNSETRNLKKRQ